MVYEWAQMSIKCGVNRLIFSHKISLIFHIVITEGSQYMKYTIPVIVFSISYKYIIIHNILWIFKDFIWKWKIPQILQYHSLNEL